MITTRMGPGVLATLIALMAVCSVRAELGKPYRLEAVDLKERVIWGGEVRAPAGKGLAFGGQDQDAADGRPHTRLLVNAGWVAIDEELREANPLQPFHARMWEIRTTVKDFRAKRRAEFFSGKPEEVSREFQDVAVAEKAVIEAALTGVLADLKKVSARHGEYEKAQGQFVSQQVGQAQKALGAVTTESPSADELSKLRHAQERLEIAAEALDAEPPPRSVNCGGKRKSDPREAGSQGMAYDPKTKLYVLFGGDHLDYLTNDTWLFDPVQRRWFQQHPEGAPPPRANHEMKSKGDGTIVLTGGYTYASNTDYVGGQYADLNDGEWIYDIGKNEWIGEGLVSADSRVYRSGPFHPEYYQQGPAPNAEAFAMWLDKLPVNEWVATDPPFRPRLNRDWGTAVIDPGRDLMLRWSGGHSAHGGTDVPHFHLATNRWELAFPVEFPLGQLYSNTSYPNGFNYNRRPWMTGHTYQNYQYDPPSKLMVKAGRPRNFYLYDPDRGDWIARGPKPTGMIYNSCFYTLTLCATPEGALCWGANGRVHRYNHAAKRWDELELAGTLPGAVVDNSTIAYDSKRCRVYLVQKPYGKAPFEGKVWAIDLKTRKVSSHSPEGHSAAARFAYLDRCVYDPVNDLVLFASYLKEAGEQTRTPAYDPATNRWVTLDLQYKTGRRGERITRAFPHGRSCGIMFDPKRKLIWGTDTNSQVYVLRLDRETAKVRLLK